MLQGYSKDQPEGFHNRIERVALIGAGGHMGSHIAEALLKTRKHVVKVISRPNSTSKMPFGAHVERIEYGDSDDSEIVQALEGQQALIITMSVAAPRDIISKLIRAAAKAGVSYILPNWYGHDPAAEKLCKDTFLADIKTRICTEIESLGVSSYILLACGFWYEFSLGGGPDRYGFDFKNRSVVVFDGGNTAINTSTWPQCGRAIASLMSLKVLPEDENDRSVTLLQFHNRPVYISSFRLTQWDMFKSIKRVTGTKDADWTITHESSAERYASAKDSILQGDHHAFVKFLYSRTFYPNGGGDFESTHGLHNGVLGLPGEDLDAYTSVAISMGENEEVVDDDVRRRVIHVLNE
ncbi:oxidoreductase CipA-like, putative [Talaromyces stipitatus ATCC 10500]|uniref:Oxidoreductase CipA-like, putative n=1 Tax=Talaromyces stipitatus (strain ATCC 10500 / CBS 375.48 / QM 6759 / NRRL 1006) TaxID=441959 RepID=B8MQW5_TALSN|nr:oxidoreductase CipA-like, putative [Talaromyces stipitatus ATCC 10500]EED12800.1 oxidoreductase CipA-like, putative [Talaromyces stipitatus ATCC 10500]